MKNIISLLLLISAVVLAQAAENADAEGSEIEEVVVKGEKPMMVYAKKKQAS